MHSGSQTPSRLPPTDRSTVKRMAERASYDRETLYAILDEGMVCHVGFSVNGQPFVIPTSYARRENEVLLHGSPGIRFFKELGREREICLTVTLLDGLVLARSVYHHSLNYRSVVLFGTPKEIVDAGQKMEALRRITNHLAPNRWEEARKPTEGEIRATSVFSLPIGEGSAKIRTGPPVDKEEDWDFPVWAGIVPFRTRLDEPVPDEGLSLDLPLPSLLESSRFCRNDRP